MSSHDRRSAGRRRAWGRGPIILRFEPLEKREVLSAAGSHLPDLVASSLVVTTKADWGDPVTAAGQITNKGRGTVDTSFQVGIYASSNGKVGPYSVLLGEVTIPAGLAPGETVPFSTSVNLPLAPVPGTTTNGSLKLALSVDPVKQVRESSERNNKGLGMGVDKAIVQIAPVQPASLVSTAAGVFPSTTQWGQYLAVTAQISNKSYGSAPASRAQVVLTPLGATPGGTSDVTLGSIAIPPLTAWSTVNVESNFNLPATPPVGFEGSSQYTLSILPDADYLTNPIYPHAPIGGAGVDQVAVTINVPPGTTVPAPAVMPDLATSSVNVSPTSLKWGQTFQVQTYVQNLGAVDPGPFRVRFVLVGPESTTVSGFFLGDTLVSSLAPGQTQLVTQSLTLPSRLPAGVTVSSLTTGKIVALIDPEHVMSETFKNNNIASSGPLALRVLGTDGTSTVPNLPQPWQLLAVNASAVTTAAPKATRATSASKPQRTFRKPPPTDNSFLHSLSIFPKQVNNFIKKYI